MFRLLLVLIIGIILCTSALAYPVIQLYKTPYQPYEIALNIPTIVNIEVLSRKGNWIELKVSWFNVSYKGWVYLYD